ncbi:MAG: hypothetical protein GX678_00950 [Actinomycetales bacterium]|nr:hypothetical protein [Actinomycetales bacterium]
MRVLGIAAMLWMIYEVLGVSNLFGYGGLSNDDLDGRRMGDALTAFFDPIGWVITTFILVVSIIIHSVAKRIARRAGTTSTTTKVSMIISIVFYVLGFFRISMIFPMLFSTIGSMGQVSENLPDQRVPTTEELVVAAPQLAHYHDSNGTRISTSLTNATDEHWESAAITITVNGAEGDVCTQFEHEESWIAPGEQRDYVSGFLNPAIDYSSSSCIPTNVTVTGSSVDIDSRSQINEADYAATHDTPEYAALTVQETAGILSSYIDVSVVGSLAPESLNMIRDDGSFVGGFEIADATGVRLEWCFKPYEVSVDGDFNTRKFHSPVEPGVYVNVVALPVC